MLRVFHTLKHRSLNGNARIDNRVDLKAGKMRCGVDPVPAPNHIPNFEKHCAYLVAAYGKYAGLCNSSHKIYRCSLKFSNPSE